MALKIVFLLAMVALVYGSPANQAKGPQSEIIKAEEIQAVQEIIAQAAEQGHGTFVLQFGDKHARGGNPMSAEMLRTCIHIYDGYIRVYSC